MAYRGPRNHAGLQALVSALVLLLVPGSTHGERPPVRFFTTADGLPSPRVASIVRDSHGFLWIGTIGLSRFDGRSFQTFGPAEGLAQPAVNYVLEERPGRYWVATNGGGLFRFTPRTAGGSPDATRFVRVAVGATSASNRVNVISRDALGRLWIGTDDGLFLMESTNEPHVTRKIAPQAAPLGDPLVQVWAVRPLANGTVWVGTSVGLVALFPDGRALHRPIRALQGADHVFALLDQADGTLLVGHDSGLFLVRPRGASGQPGALEVLQPWTTQSRSSLSSVRAIIRTTDGNIWFTGTNGVTRIDGEHHRLVVDTRELEGAPVAIAEDSAGNLWVSRLTGGVARITRAGVVEYDVREGLGEPPYGRMFEARSGEFCVVGRREISVFDGRSFISVKPAADVLRVGRTYGLAHEDSEGDWWIPAGDRLNRFPSVTRVSQLATIAPKAVYTIRDGLAGVDISRIFEDSRGDIWLNSRIPGRDVVTRWDRASGAFHRYGERQGLRPFNAVLGFAEDRSGAIWLSFLEGGLARYRRGKFEWVPGLDGAGVAISALHIDRPGRLWIATNQDVRRIEHTSSEASADLRAAVVPGLEGTRVWVFVEDRQGRLYLNAAEGLIRWDLEGERPLHIAVRGQAASHGAWTAFADRQGALWFAGPRGVTRLVPPETIAPTLVRPRIGALRINGRPLALDDLGQADVPLLTFAPHERRIEIGFFALGRSGDEDIRFQYRLQGGTSDWSPPSPAASVDFAHLAAGSYRFEVRPVGADGAPVGAPATVSFRIQPPVWARWWFLAIATIVLAGAGATFHRRRVARAVELERIRTSIASDLHDDIGANLSQISLLSEMLHGKGLAVDPRDASTLASISDLSRESVDAMGDIVWAIDPEKDHLTSLTRRMRRFASELLSARNIRFVMSLTGPEDVEIGAVVRRHVYLVFKEALNNVVRHSGATQVQVDLQLGPAELELRVCDNGRGFDTSVSGDGHGLRSLRERAVKAGGALDVHSAAGTGTTIVLRIPMGNAYLIM